MSPPAYHQVISLSAIPISLGYRPAIKNTNELVRINGAPQKYLVCGELPILPEPSIRRGRFHPAVGPSPSRLRAVFAIRILEIGAADRVFRAPGLEGSGTGLIQNQPRGTGRELLERRGGSMREAPLAAIAVLVFAVRTAEG